LLSCISATPNPYGRTIVARIQGKQITTTPRAPIQTVSLMEVLKKSVEQAREQKEFSKAVKEEKPIRRPRKKVE